MLIRSSSAAAGRVSLLQLQSKPAHLPRNPDELGRALGGLTVEQCLQTSAATGLHLESIAQRGRENQKGTLRSLTINI